MSNENVQTEMRGTALEELIKGVNVDKMMDVVTAKVKALRNARENAETCAGTDFGEEEAQRARRLESQIKMICDRVNGIH